MAYTYLDHIDSPHDLRRLSEPELLTLTDELRQYLLQSVSGSGGHFGAGLGVVELTVALHYVFDTPRDRLVWDVGHQAYPHKVLTGRKQELPTIRQRGGLAPFPRREESVYDTFGVGHAGTSVGAALGFAIAAARTGIDRSVVAVLGDGGLTSGMAYEAMNHAGESNSDVLVVLNDNGMSISPNVGALTTYLARCVSSRLYNQLRDGGMQILSHVPPIQGVAKRIESATMGLFVPGSFFTALGFSYYGPVDGHDLPSLLSVLRNLRGLHGPRLLHVVTQKGKGYPQAEANRVTYHSVPPFELRHGVDVTQATKPEYNRVFGEWACDMAARDDRLVAVTPAMREGSDLVAFSQRYPDRYFDVGIAEQHAVTLAAGLACDGLHPVVAIYSTFLQRAYDQLIHDVALQNLPVLLAIDRGGVVGNDGPTHNGSFDLSFLRCVPNLIVMAPADENECRQMLYTGYQAGRPAAVRYPRGKGPGAKVEKTLHALPIGKGEIRRHGNRIAILAFGAMLATAEQAAERLDATVANMRFVRPLDENLIRRLAESHELLVTLEDNVVTGGAGSGVAECLAAHRLLVPMLLLGLPDRFQEHGSRDDQLREAGLTHDGIIEAINRFERKQRPAPQRLRAQSG